MLTADQSNAKMLARTFFRESPQAYAASVSLQSPSVIAGYGIGSRNAADDSGRLEDVLVVYVHKKTPALKWIPPRIGDIPTQIVEVGQVRPTSTSGADPTKRHRPAPGGVSIGHPAITVGTFGCLVEKAGDWFILSNNHVLAHANQAQPGDKIIQTASADGGLSPQDDIATLTEFCPLQFQEDEPNLIDAAIARVDRREDVSPSILQIGQLKPTVCDADINQRVCKYGRTSRYTEGTITAIHSDIAVTYRINGQDHTVWFDDQIIIESPQDGHFSRPGDSGSLIVTKDTSQAIGLLFANSDAHRKITIANPIESILTHFQVRLVV